MKNLDKSGRRPPSCKPSPSTKLPRASSPTTRRTVCSPPAFCLSESEGKNRGGMRSALEFTAKHLEAQKHLAAGSGSLKE